MDSFKETIKKAAEGVNQRISEIQENRYDTFLINNSSPSDTSFPRSVTVVYPRPYTIPTKKKGELNSFSLCLK